MLGLKGSLIISSRSKRPCCRTLGTAIALGMLLWICMLSFLSLDSQASGSSGDVAVSGQHSVDIDVNGDDEFTWEWTSERPVDFKIISHKSGMTIHQDLGASSDKGNEMPDAAGTYTFRWDSAYPGQVFLKYDIAFTSPDENTTGSLCPCGTLFILVLSICPIFILRRQT